VSRRHGIWLTLFVLGLLVGCTNTKEAEKRAEVQKLQARAAYDRALSYLNDRQPAGAIASLQEAININPESALYRDTLGVVLLELGRPDMALEHFKKAVELNPMYADAHFHMGTALAESRRWNEAVASYRKALELPTLTIPETANQNLGLALYHLKQYRRDEAKAAFRQARQLAPDSPVGQAALDRLKALGEGG
jgi:Tfp pilus assembly protein PilF